MNAFADSASTFIDNRPDAAARRRAWSLFEATGLPTTSDEVWRYAPLGDLAIDRFAVPVEPTTQADSEFATKLRQRAGVVVRVVDGFCVSTGEVVEGLTVDIDETNDSLSGETLLQRYESDSFALLNAALAPSTTVLRVEAGVNLAQPVVVLNESSAGASFPRTQIVLGRGASVTVVEYFEGGADALVVPVSEYRLEDNASLQLITYQRLDERRDSWPATRDSIRPSSGWALTMTDRGTTPNCSGRGPATNCARRFSAPAIRCTTFALVSITSRRARPRHCYPRARWRGSHDRSTPD
jgi:hypothetical protein